MRTRIALWLILGGSIVANFIAFLNRRAEWGEFQDLLRSFPTASSTEAHADPVVCVAASCVALLLLAALAITLTRRWGAIRARRRFKTTPTDNRHLVAFCIYYLSLTVVSMALLEWELVAMVAPVGTVAALVWLWRRGSARITLGRGWGLYVGRPVMVEIGWGVAAYLANWSVSKTLAWLWAGSTVSLPLGSTEPPWWVPLPFLFFLLVQAPVVEETFCRGALHCELRRSVGWLAASLVGAIAFAAAHWLTTWFQFCVLLVSGLVFCVLREWRNSLVAPMMAHLAMNGVPKLGMLLGLPRDLF
jgi:membrane protease YdiL (CAAX protease family)